MADLNLVYSRARYTGGPIDLVFGSTGTPAEPTPLTAHGTTVFGGVSGSGLALYNNLNPRRVSASSRQPHQPASSAHHAPQMPSALPLRLLRGHEHPLQAGQDAAAEPRQPWLQSGRVRTERAQAHQVAAAIAAQAAQVHQAALQLRASAAQVHQVAAALQALAAQPHQVALLTHTGGAQAHQVAASLQALARQLHRVARFTNFGFVEPWQVARPVPPGKEVWPPVPTGPGFEPHVPDLNLVFACPAYAGGPVNLVFGRVCGNEPLPALIVVPIRGVYMTINSLALTRVSDGATLPAKAFGMQLGADAWTWSWSATLSGSALDLLAPGSGNPVELQATINGVAYRLFAESISRTRRFGEHSLAVSGRGLGAVLDAPYALSLSFGSASSRTAQQLAGEALQINGVDIGWDVDWGLEDWLVPGGVWSHQGSHISAVNAIAAAAGGYVQPHATARTLRVLPRYPVAPWDWAGVTPDIELPSAPVVVEGIQWQSKAAYNRVFVRSQGGSFAGDVKRTGTMGEVDAPMVVDQLITAAAAARQRGLAVLGDTGQQAAVSLSLPVLAETGLILPGKFVRYVDGATERLGLVRSTSLAWEQPKLRQTITLETHI